MRARWLCLIAAGLLWLTPAVHAARSLSLGILPVHTVRVLVDRYEPLRRHLEAYTGLKVRIETAPSFRLFHVRAQRGDFDVLVTPAHLARLGELAGTLRPVAQFQPDHASILISRADTPFSLPAGLKGRHLAVIDPLAMTVMVVLDHLARLGLQPQRDYTLGTYRTHASAIHALLTGEASAAVTTQHGLYQIPEDIRSKIRPVVHLHSVPAFVLAVDDRSSHRERLLQAIAALPHSAEAIDLLARTGYTGIRMLRPDALRAADRYLPHTYQLLAEPASQPGELTASEPPTR